jgi:hypothetical protein
VSRLQAEWPGVRIQTEVRGSPLLRSVHTGPVIHPASYSKGLGLCTLRVKLGHNANHSLSSGAEFRNGWSYTSTPPIYVQGLDRNSFTFSHVASSYASFPICSFSTRALLQKAVSPPRMGVSPKPSALAHNVPVLALGWSFHPEDRRSNLTRNFENSLFCKRTNILTIYRRSEDCFIQSPGSYRAVNTFQLGYKNQSVYDVSGISRSLFSDKYETNTLFLCLFYISYCFVCTIVDYLYTGSAKS